MGMRMMFIVFLLVVLATTVVSFASDRTSDGRNAAANAFDLIARSFTINCCKIPSCFAKYGSKCSEVH
uniref:A superfamily conotoxin Ca1.7a n=1 Tax=Conus caracteristicus TaxID=89440 RepID=S4UJS9_CONCB|nr:A superfamily conotoxin Ca1.7c precursor [Conus caracteristicus]AGK23281.1 A superfamily conotoxin Ca1.7b precursor [Conus caracteristicus]AGK23282.1 A superfamily conotoxin Ca1.7a precursor [Conus caracteristicus]